MKKKLMHQNGVGLIEVLVTVLLLATGLLVMAALQIRSLQFNQSAYLRSQANILAYDIIDRIRLNGKNVGSYTILFANDPPLGSALVNIDLREWRDNLSATMPDGKGQVQCVSNGKCTVQIQWKELNSSGETSEDTTTFSFSTQI